MSRSNGEVERRRVRGSRSDIVGERERGGGWVVWDSAAISFENRRCSRYGPGTGGHPVTGHTESTSHDLQQPEFNQNFPLFLLHVRFFNPRICLEPTDRRAYERWLSAPMTTAHPASNIPILSRQGLSDVE